MACGHQIIELVCNIAVLLATYHSSLPNQLPMSNHLPLLSHPWRPLPASTYGAAASNITSAAAASTTAAFPTAILGGSRSLLNWGHSRGWRYQDVAMLAPARTNNMVGYNIVRLSARSRSHALCSSGWRERDGAVLDRSVGRRGSVLLIEHYNWLLWPSETLSPYLVQVKPGSIWDAVSQ